jgi:hypothetical protein
MLLILIKERNILAVTVPLLIQDSNHFYLGLLVKLLELILHAQILDLIFRLYFLHKDKLQHTHLATARKHNMFPVRHQFLQLDIVIGPVLGLDLRVNRPSCFFINNVTDGIQQHVNRKRHATPFHFLVNVLGLVLVAECVNVN